MSETKKRQLLAWCENSECGKPIYTGDKHTEEVSGSGNRYFYCAGCLTNTHTPDEDLEQEDN